MKKRILIIEDNGKIREGFAALIDSTEKYMVTGSYGNCKDAIKNLERDSPNVVLMDIDLPGMNGIEGTLKIKKTCPDLLFLSSPSLRTMIKYSDRCAQVLLVTLLKIQTWKISSGV